MDTVVEGTVVEVGPAATARATAEPGPPPRRLGPLLAAIVLVGLAVAVVASPDGRDDAGPTPTVAPTTAPTVRPTAADAALAPRSLTLSAGTRLAYAAAGGVVIVDVATGRVDVTEVDLTAPEVAYDDPFVLVADDRRTLAVHPAAPDEPFVLASNYRVVPTAAPDQYVFVPAPIGLDEADEVFVGQAQDGSFGPRIALPPASRRLAVPGVGVFVSGPDGGTHAVGFTGLERISDSTVVAATARHRLELDCDEALDCEARVVGVDGAVTPVGVDVARLGLPTLSPDGRRLAARAGAGVVRHDLATGETRDDRFADPVLALAWSDDGDRLGVLLGPRDRARVVLLDADDGPDTDAGEETEVVDLAARGAPAPLAGLVVF